MASKPMLPVIEMPSSRFAKNEILYRLSKGHGGAMCEGCYGSTHAIWPVQPDDFDGTFIANDNCPMFFVSASGRLMINSCAA